MKIEIYGKKWCSYCYKAKQLCIREKLDFVYKELNKDFSKDLAKITLLLVSTFTLFNFFSFESNFLSVSAVSLSTVLILFVSLNLLKFKYIKIGKNK